MYVNQKKVGKIKKINLFLLKNQAHSCPVYEIEKLFEGAKHDKVKTGLHNTLKLIYGASCYAFAFSSDEFSMFLNY